MRPLGVGLPIRALHVRYSGKEFDRQSRQRHYIYRVEFQRLLAEVKARVCLLAVSSKIKQRGLAPQRQFLGVRVRRMRPLKPGRLDIGQLNSQRVRQPRDNFVLCLQQIGLVIVEFLGPEMRAGLRVDELSVGADVLVGRLHRTFDHIAHAQLLADLPHIGRLALVGEGRIAGDDEAAGNARDVGRQFVGEHVGEIILLWIAGQILERQHHDAKPRTVIFRHAGFAQPLINTLAHRQVGWVV